MRQFEKLVYSSVFDPDTVEPCDNKKTESSDSQTIESDPERGENKEYANISDNCQCAQKQHKPRLHKISV